MNSVFMMCTPKVGLKNLTLWGAFFMGKHHKYEIKLKIVQEYLQGKLSYKRLAEKYNLSNESLIKRWVRQKIKE